MKQEWKGRPLRTDATSIPKTRYDLENIGQKRCEKTEEEMES
jgi:hypothetical protein